MSRPPVPIAADHLARLRVLLDKITMPKGGKGVEVSRYGPHVALNQLAVRRLVHDVDSLPQLQDDALVSDRPGIVKPRRTRDIVEYS